MTRPILKPPPRRIDFELAWGVFILALSAAAIWFAPYHKPRGAKPAQQTIIQRSNAAFGIDDRRTADQIVSDWQATR